MDSESEFCTCEPRLTISAQGFNGIKANVKAVQGELYFLEKGLIFIAKQPILVDFSKVESISFSR